MSHSFMIRLWTNQYFMLHVTGSFLLPLLNSQRIQFAGMTWTIKSWLVHDGILICGMRYVFSSQKINCQLIVVFTFVAHLSSICFRSSKVVLFLCCITFLKRQDPFLGRWIQLDTENSCCRKVLVAFFTGFAFRLSYTSIATHPNDSQILPEVNAVLGMFWGRNINHQSFNSLYTCFYVYMVSQANQFILDPKGLFQNFGGTWSKDWHQFLAYFPPLGFATWSSYTTGCCIIAKKRPPTNQPAK